MRETDRIIDTLVADLKPVRARALERRFLTGILTALAISLLLMLTIVGLRVDFPEALMLPVFWIKSAYNALLAIVAFFALRRLARPDGSKGAFFKVSGFIFLALSVVAVVQLSLSSADQYGVLVLGSSALHCPLLIILFALPVLVSNFWVLRRGAPIDLPMTGFVAGVAAGASGAWVYSWFCTENGMPFVALWYSLGILLTGFIGAMLGNRLLRW